MTRACSDELTDDELRAGGLRLEAKVKRWRPTVVAFVGIGPYRIVSGVRDARVGLQEAPFGGSHAWVLPNPSGINAHYPPAALAGGTDSLPSGCRRHRKESRCLRGTSCR